jgi:hypothetical protein
MNQRNRAGERMKVMPLRMKTTDYITIQAFVGALTQLQAPVSEPLRQQIYSIGEKLINYQPCVVECIRMLVAKHELLRHYYRIERKRLHQHYKMFPPADQFEQDTNLNTETLFLPVTQLQEIGTILKQPDFLEKLQVISNR